MLIFSYLNFFSAFFCIAFLSHGTATLINKQVLSFFVFNYYVRPVCQNLSICLYHHLENLFLITDFKGIINCHSILGTVGIRVPTRQIRECSTFIVSGALRHGPSARGTLLRMTYADFWTFLTKTYALRTLSRYETMFRLFICI
jgi:hypothetical protein